MPKTTIGKSLFLDGELTGKDGLIIKGKLNGNIKVEGSILVEKDAIVKADIHANNVKYQVRSKATFLQRVTCIIWKTLL